MMKIRKKFIRILIIRSMHSLNQKNVSAKGGSASGGKKILLVTRPLSPPWDEASKNFAYYLAKNVDGFQFTLLVNKIIKGLPENIQQERIYTSSNFGFLQKLYLLRYLRRYLRRFDIAHFVFTPTKLSSALIKKFALNNKVGTLQTIATLREDLFSDEEIKKLIFGNLAVTYSDYAKNKLEKLGLKNTKRIYPGIDLGHYSSAPKNIKLINDLGISGNDFVIVYPGEYTRLGATDDIAKSLPQIFKSIPNAKFIFACRIKGTGDIQKKKEIKNKLQDKGLLSKITFIDTFSDMPKLYNLSDVVIFPAKDMKGKFDVPLVVVEAMACEKPVIISDLPVLKEFANSHNSVTIKSGDVKQLIEATSDLYKNKSKREEIGKNARKYAEENFDIKKVAEEYKKIYESL